MAKATWNNVTLAESNDVVEVEGNVYFPASALNRTHVRDSATHTTCGWKGIASYYDVVVGNDVNPDAVWFYPAPIAGAEKVADRVAFWKGVAVTR
jgi:uncharacterized protein (DUF427 family)